MLLLTATHQKITTIYTCTQVLRYLVGCCVHTCLYSFVIYLNQLCNYLQPTPLIITAITNNDIVRSLSFISTTYFRNGDQTGDSCSKSGMSLETGYDSIDKSFEGDSIDKYLYHDFT